LDFYKSRKDFLDGICLTGGEPCLYEDLADFLKPFKDVGARIKLDTNGTNPERVKELVNAGLIDYIAMDIKNKLDFESYKKASRIKSEILFNNAKESINYIMNCGVPYEFRTTVVPTIHTKDEIINIGEHIKGAAKFALQNFQPENTLDENFEKLTPYKMDEIKDMAEAIRPYIDEVVVRGKD
jgi:pyruvate formate lyase activating enzyme